MRGLKVGIPDRSKPLTYAGGVQVVLEQRKARAVLHSQYEHIVRIQAAVRMWLARRYYLNVKRATTCAPSSATTALQPLLDASHIAGEY